MERLHVEYWPIERIRKPERSLRRHSEGALSKMAVAIREFGFRVPLLVKADGEIIDGGFRLDGARAAGLSEVPVILVDDLDDPRIMAFRIAFNRLAELASWEMELLKLEMEELLDIGVNLELTASSEREIADFLGGLGEEGLTVLVAGTGKEVMWSSKNGHIY